jgi:predicted DNA binding CopG/RHH family protein
MKKKTVLDKDEEQLIADYERGAFRPVKNQDMARKEAMEAARRYLRKDARINIRLSTADLDMLKQRAAEEGLPYQSLIASILHKYVSRSAPQANQPVRVLDSTSRVESALTMHNTRSDPTKSSHAPGRLWYRPDLDSHADYESVRPEPVEGRPPFANRATSSQSPRIIASFFCRLQPLIRRSQANASSRVVNASLKTKATGRLERV